MKKFMSIPNTLTIMRIILVIFSFIFIKTQFFFYLYITAGFTDFLDGYFARRLKQATLIGSQLDSIADIFLMGSTVAFIIHFEFELITRYSIILCILFIVKCAVILITYMKYKKLVIIHTIGNKILGFLIFLLPLIVHFINENYYLITLVIACVVILEELLIVIVHKKIDVNRKYLWGK